MTSLHQPFDLFTCRRGLARVGLSVVFALLAFAAHGARASAQSIGERVQLGLRSSVLNVRYGTHTQLNGYGSFGASLGLGGVGTSVGYAFDEQWLATLGATVTHDFSSDPAYLDHTTYQARPGLAYVFGEGTAVRPLLGLELGVGRSKSRYFDGVHVGASALGGVQLHLSSHLSLEPTLSIGYQYAHMTLSDTEPSSRARTHGLDVHGWLGLSAWL